MSNGGRHGILFAVGAYLCWGLLPVYWKTLQHVPATEILAHRMASSLVVVVALLAVRRSWSWIRVVLRDWRTLLTFTASALLLSLNWLLYIWAVNSDHVVEASLGYFINPLVSVVLGMLFLRERLRAPQVVAVLTAATGVLYLTANHGRLPWIALGLALTFAFYGLLRKTATLASLEGLALETGLLFLPAFFYLVHLETAGRASFGHVDTATSLLLLLAGAATAVPLLLFAAGARRIPLTVLGVLQYIAPTLQFLLGVFVYGETLTRERLIGFCFVWVALLIFAGEGILQRRSANLRTQSLLRPPMRTHLLLLVIGSALALPSLAVLPASAQRPDSATRAALAAATGADHRRMMDLLGIAELRPGPSGNPQAPNAANNDEAKVPAYTLPDPLVLENGRPVGSAQEWWDTRRPEIVELFDREVYGRMPDDVPAVRWEVASTTREVNGDHAVIVKKLVGRADNSAHPDLDVSIDLTLTTPADASEPVPVMMHFGFSFPAGARPPAPPPSAADAPAPPTWQQQLLANGWGYAVLVPTSFQADNGAGLTEGIIGLTNRGQPRKPDDWGTLRAWAWGASRALDYLETDPAVDAEKVGMEGLSRYGKAALVAIAYEPRLAIGFIGSSGAGGAKILRRIFGEQVENLASSGEYHWFAGNFIRYAGPLTEQDLPVDAHELIALVAPRPLFISVGSPTVEGEWVDARGMFLAGVHAGPVYRLLGAADLGTAEFPPMETPLIGGEIAFRQHSGGHTTGPNWPTFLEWSARYIQPAEPQ